jgi:hypothetical protein
MPVKASEPSFLHVYDVELGSWANVMLGSPVSPVLVEAMNLILSKDGILAYIGTRLEFGHYLSELKNETGKDFRHCWTSLPASTIMSMLGLCLNSENPRTPLLVFYGSPLTVMLAMILDYKRHGLDIDEKGSFTRLGLDNAGYFFISVEMQKAIGAVGDRMINATEYYEALSYLEDEDDKETEEKSSQIGEQGGSLAPQSAS